MKIACGSFQRSKDEVVVLFTFFVTDDPAPNGRHIRVQHTYGAATSEIRQHDGVMTDAVEIAAGLRRAPCVGVGRCDGRGRGARAEVRLPFPPPTYI